MIKIAEWFFLWLKKEPLIMFTTALAMYGIQERMDNRDKDKTILFLVTTKDSTSLRLSEDGKNAWKEVAESHKRELYLTNFINSDTAKK